MAAMCPRFAFSCKFRNLPVSFHKAFHPSSFYFTAQLDSTYDPSRGYHLNNMNVYRCKYESAALSGSTREAAAQCLYSNKNTKRTPVHLHFSLFCSLHSKAENSSKLIGWFVGGWLVGCINSTLLNPYLATLSSGHYCQAKCLRFTHMMTSID
jgi:hypothetical protein